VKQVEKRERERGGACRMAEERASRSFLIKKISKLAPLSELPCVKCGLNRSLEEIFSWAVLKIRTFGLFGIG
jgi:hypothetical protein